MAIQVVRDFTQADRYLYDFRVLTYEKGWAQVDTKQDASYYGTWTNPETRQIFNYCEGDCTLTKCDTDEDYCKALGETVEWNKNAGYWLGIDPGLGHAMEQRFRDLGLGEFLH